MATKTLERTKHVNQAVADFWSSRVLHYTDFRNFIAKAREACANSGHTVSDHFVDITDMVCIGSGAQRPVEDWALSRYGCYLVIQIADPGKPLLALGQSYFAVQTHRQELVCEAPLARTGNAPSEQEECQGSHQWCHTPSRNVVRSANMQGPTGSGCLQLTTRNHLCAVSKKKPRV